MSSSLQALVALQEHDTAIDQLQRRLGALPERAAAHDLNEQRRAIEARIASLDAQLDALAATEEAVEEELATVEARIASLDAMLRAPGSATRDAGAIVHEIDQLRERAGAVEERGLELLEQRDGVLNEQKAAHAELDAVAAQAPVALAALKQAEGEAGAELARLQDERAAIVPSVDPALLATYDRLRPRLEGVAVARVVSGACSGCHLSIAAVDLERIARLGPGEHATCEQCGRILIPA